MTQPITTPESAEQMAERLLPCDDARACAHDLHPCPATFHAAIAAALRAKDERITELEAIIARTATDSQSPR